MPNVGVDAVPKDPAKLSGRIDAREIQTEAPAGLRRSLSPASVVAVTLAYVSPTITVLVIFVGVLSVGGTFGVDAGILMIPVVLAMCLCFAELTSKYPAAGSMYSLVRHTLPQPLGVIAFFGFFVWTSAGIASFALGLGLFVRDLLPAIHLGDKVFAGGLMVLVTGIALQKTKTGAWLTGVLVVCELTVLGVITVAALLHPHQNVGHILFHPQVLGGHGASTLIPITGAFIAATIAPAFNYIAGYDASLSFAEEIEAKTPQTLARVVLLCGVLSCALIILPSLAAMVAAPNLSEFLKAPVPALYSIRQSLGGFGGTLVDIAGIISVISISIAGLMYFSRVLFASARDGLWPGFIGKGLASTNAASVPGVAVVVAGVLPFALCFISSLTFLLVFIGTLISMVVLLVAAGAVVDRIRDGGRPAPYRMRFWPVPPVIVIAVAGFALIKQETKYLVAGAVLLGISIAFWALSRLWNPDWGWRPAKFVDHAATPVGHLREP